MRLFAAVLPDESFRQELETIQAQMKKKGIRGRYTDPFNLHLTLVFIGEYGNPDDVMDVLEEIPFEPSVLIPHRIEKLRDMYVLTFEENEIMTAYVRRIHRAFSKAGIPFDRKSFWPHITLVRKAEQDPAVPLSSECGPFACDSVSLMRSERGRNGMVYTETGKLEFPLSEEE